MGWSDGPFRQGVLWLFIHTQCKRQERDSGTRCSVLEPIESMVSVFQCLNPTLELPCIRRCFAARSFCNGHVERRKKNPSFVRASLLEAAKYTVDTYIRSGMVIGLGSGHASGMAVQYLGQKLRERALKDIVGVPMSVASASEAAKAGIPLDPYGDSSQIDFAFDDADIIEEGTLIAIIGRRRLQGEESIIQEKSILKEAAKIAYIVTEKQYTSPLDGSIPVLVNKYNWMETAEAIDDLFLGDAEVWRRPALGHAGPLGGDFPLVTREGHNVLDVIFTSPIQDLVEVAENLDKINGVVDHGIVSGIVSSAVIASERGPWIVGNFTKRL